MGRNVLFSPAEVEILLSLLKKYENILTNKKTDNKTNCSKEEDAWKKITNQFNSTANIKYHFMNL